MTAPDPATLRASTRESLVWIGLAGVPPEDNARAHLWERRLQWLMVGVALLAVPAYVIAESKGLYEWHALGRWLDLAIFTAFLVETVWMTSISSHPGRYLARSWMNLAILAATAASFAGSATAWVAMVRLLRVFVGGIVLLKVGVNLSVLFTRRGAPYLTGAALAIALIAGGLLFWLEPQIRTFWDGVWLAFITATTIGYGDIVPSTPAGRAVTVIVALLGWALLSLFTANVVAMFLDRDELPERERIAAEIEALRREIARIGRADEAGAAGPPSSPQDIAAEIDALDAQVREVAHRTARLAQAVRAAEGPRAAPPDPGDRALTER